MAKPDVPISRIEQYLDQIEQNTAGGGGGGSGGGGVFVVHSHYDENTGVTTLDKTWQEIWDALDAGQFPTIVSAYSDEYGNEGDISYINNLWSEDGACGLQSFAPYYNAGDVTPVIWGASDYTTDSADGYPSYGGDNAE